MVQQRGRAKVEVREVRCQTLLHDLNYGRSSGYTANLYKGCTHGCVYCYAVRSNELAITRFRTHNPASEYLYDDPDGPRPQPSELPIVPQHSFDF